LPVFALIYCAAARIDYSRSSGSQQVVVLNKVAHPGQSSHIRGKGLELSPYGDLA